MSRQVVPVIRIGMNGRSLQDHVKTWQLAEVNHVNPGNRNSSTEEDANHKASSVLCKLLQQQAAPEVGIDCFGGNPLNYHYFMALFCEVVETKIEDPRGRSTRLLMCTVGEARELRLFVSSLTFFSSVRVYQIINTGMHWTLLKYCVC